MNWLFLVWFAGATPDSKLKKLAILVPIRFDTPLGAAKETTNGYQNKRAPKKMQKKNLPYPFKFC